jgi:chromosomal replication initiation ATPase DnaA
MKTPTFITEIANRIEAITGVTFEEICSTNRKGRIMRARHALMWYLYRKHSSGFSFAEIGKMLNRHHASVFHGVQQVDWAIDNKDRRFKFIQTIEDSDYICPQCGCKRNHTPAVQ